MFKWFRADESVFLLGDLNARIGEGEIEGMIGKIGVPRVNGSGERLIGMCSELGLLIGNKFFRKRLIHKYTWERVEHGVITDRAVMDYVMVPRRF